MITNKGLVWAFHSDKVLILSFLFVYEKVIQIAVYVELPKWYYNTENKVVLEYDTTFSIY